MGEQKTTEYWAGVDWGDEEHAVVVVDDHRQVVARFKVPHSAQGLDWPCDTAGAEVLEMRALQRVALWAVK